MHEHPGDTSAGETAEAADTGEERPRSGRGMQLVVALLLAVLGFAVVTQVRTSNVDDSFAGLRQQDLIDILNGLSGTTQRAEEEIERLERARAELSDDSSRRRAALEQAEAEANTLSILAGQVPVEGPGIRITLTQETGPIKVSTMLDLLQELRTSKAEAIAINGTVRVVASTSFEQGLERIVVDGKPLQAPYVIDVIGEPNTLAQAVTFAGGIPDLVEADGGSIEVEQFNAVPIQIEVVAEAEDPDFATFDGSEGP